MSSRKIILAVDDMPENLVSYSSLLEDYFDIRLAKSAKLALMLLKDIHVDLILLDIEMPEMSGFDFLQYLREKNEKNKQVPVLFVTSHAESDFIEKAINAGARDYLLKPLNPELLFKKIDTIIGLPKYKITSLEGKIESLKSAVSAADTSEIKNLMDELEKMEHLTPYAKTIINDFKKLIMDLEYNKCQIKIDEFLTYLSKN